ncbi:xylulokinase [Candidatus Bipolaricaulota bacterium]|nr:xylulokinase [Candidatus Bipolaricaulota bacterium]
MSTYLLGLDLGTSAAKAVLLDSDGKVVNTGKASYPLSRPRKGWAEQDPEDWWGGLVKATHSATENLGNKDEVKALALSGQMHGSVFLDSSGEVIRPPLLWNDTRTTAQCREMEEVLGLDTLKSEVGNPILEGFTAPKLLWLRENERNNFERLATLLLPKDYIVYRMTGRTVTEVSDAAGTVLFNVSEGTWSEEVLGGLDLDRSILPPVLESTDTVGKLNRQAAEELGLSPDAVVVAGGADNACSAIGNGVLNEGQYLISVGSSGVVLAPTETMYSDPEDGLHSFNHAAPHRWYLMGVMLSAGLSLRWYRDKFAGPEREVAFLTGDDPYDLITAVASRVPIGAERLIFLPYLNGERTPHADPNARGVLFGLSDEHGREHLARAVIEGITFGLRDSMELVSGFGVPRQEIRLTGGGSKSEFWAQVIADNFDSPVNKTSVSEGPGFGAALLAGVGAGIYASVEEAVEIAVTAKKVAEPREGAVKKYEKLYGIYKSLYDALEDKFSSLAGLEAIK